ncbi:MAG TPA: hypothetical protein VKM93_25275 [Terriglobia bacterium]|nr:hypothetical protein [Terriglobia bacterium]
MRVPRSTHAPLTLPALLSAAGHWDQRSATHEPLAFIIAPPGVSRTSAASHDSPDAGQIELDAVPASAF